KDSSQTSGTSATVIMKISSTCKPKYSMLHSFTGGSSDGSGPLGNLIFSRDGTTLYGMTEMGGTKGHGVIFSEPVGGGAPTILHSFTGGSLDGSEPFGSLILSGDGTTLYGMTMLGGTLDWGVI